MNENQRLGKRGEEAVAARLASMGMEIVARNYSCPPHGELDIVARSSESILFVEVKSRIGDSGLKQAVRSAQIGRLKRMARIFLSRSQLWERDYRFWVFYVLFRSPDDPDPFLISVEDPFC